MISFTISGAIVVTMASPAIEMIVLKYFMFPDQPLPAMQRPKTPQWWSKSRTHRWHVAQWWPERARGGREGPHAKLQPFVLASPRQPPLASHPVPPLASYLSPAAGPASLSQEREKRPDAQPQRQFRTRSNRARPHSDEPSKREWLESAGRQTRQRVQ